MPRAYDQDPTLKFIVKVARTVADDCLRKEAREAVESALKIANQWGNAPAFHACRDALQDIDGTTGGNATSSNYGWCPFCGQPGIERERKPNGNDKCGSGHVYPSDRALQFTEAQPA